MNLQKALSFKTQYALNFNDEINVDIFAGGGGASTGFEMGTNMPVHIAINHDEDAISLHMANHPHTKHYISDVYEVDPIEACRGRPVRHLHLSPECTHHSQASGGQPRKKASRSLGWVTHLWAGKVRPRVITLENVKQILEWSPLVAKRCKQSGRVIKLDRTVAKPGERVPIENQYLIPCQKRKGKNWRDFVQGLKRMGYEVDWKIIQACDFGAPTTRERLFLIARCDGIPIEWPKASHRPIDSIPSKRWRTVEDCIDWSVKGRSIFNRTRPVADNSMERIAKGVVRYVFNEQERFIVPIANYGSGKIVHSAKEPLRTITAYPKGGAFAIAEAKLVEIHPIYAHLHPGGAALEQDIIDGALQTSAFLIQYYSEGGQWGSINKPMNTITTRDRMALVTVTFKERPFLIVDITLRMLLPRELCRAQAFPDSYIIERGHDGRRFSKAKQVKFIGNSVSPLPMAAIATTCHKSEIIAKASRAA